MYIYIYMCVCIYLCVCLPFKIVYACEQCKILIGNATCMCASTLQIVPVHIMLVICAFNFLKGCYIYLSHSPCNTFKCNLKTVNVSSVFCTLHLLHNMSYLYSVLEINVLLFKKILTLLFLFSLYKLNSRNSTLSKTAGVADGSRREALMKVIMREFMSSEESGNEMINNKRRAESNLAIKVYSRIGRIFKWLNSLSLFLYLSLSPPLPVT